MSRKLTPFINGEGAVLVFDENENEVASVTFDLTGGVVLVSVYRDEDTLVNVVPVRP